MAFKNLSERFGDKINDLYRGTSRTEVGIGEPYIEFKPNDNNLDDIRSDTRSVPVESIKRDLKRMTKFSLSTRGLTWLLNQEILQTGNTYSETRLINPLFVIGNVQPFVNIRRALATQKEFDLNGDQTKKSPASSNNIGTSGRLQKTTSKSVISLVSGGNNSSLLDGLIKYLPPTKLISFIGAGLGLTSTIGTLDIDIRPELDMDGNNSGKSYYSVLLWEGFTRKNKTSSPFNRAASQIRVGNIGGAIKNIVSGVKNIVNTIGDLFGKRKLVSPLSREANLDNRNDPYNFSMSGRRYFITGPEEADRYLEKSVVFDPDPRVSMSYMNRSPYLLYGSGIKPPTSKSYLSINSKSDSIDIFSIVPKTKTTIINEIKKGLSGLVKNTVSKLVNGSKISLNSSTPQSNLLIPNVLSNKLSLNPISNPSNPTNVEENPAEVQMRYPELSLRQQYENDERLEFIRSELAKQKETWMASIPTSNMGFGGGYTPGKDIKIDPYSKTNNLSGHYFFDNLNSNDFAIIDENKQASITSDNTIKQLRKLGSGLIDLFIFDYVNKKTIPFRANITGLNENVNPRFDSTQYIGRNERNIIYTGATRDLNFVLTMHAFNSQEMTAIYRKLNYLTGLCFPSTYSHGFMIPPYVKLTLGDLYVNQPGFFTSLNHTVEDTTTWEIDEGLQAPHGITVSISFSIIEKKQMQTNDIDFYHYGQPRTQTNSELGNIIPKGIFGF